MLGATLLLACNDDGSSPALITEPEDTSKQAKRGGVARYFAPADPSTLDPSVANFAAEVPRMMAYSTLLRFKPGMYGPSLSEPIADLAESWEFSPDGTQLVLKLRPNVRWHNLPPVNGRLFDVDDVVFSANRAARLNSSRAEFFNSVNPQAPILSVTATDARTIAIKLKEPIYFILSILANNVGGRLNMVPKEAESALDLRYNVIGTGPFMLDEYTPSSRFKFKRNPTFYDTANGSYIDELEMPIVPEYATAVSQLQAGNVYTYDLLRGEDVLGLKRQVPELNLYQADIQPISSMANIMTAFGWLPDSPFQDERVRQAYSMALDRELWLDSVYNTSGFTSQGLPVETRWHSSVFVILDGWLDPRHKDFGTNAAYFQHNVVEAKKLLAAAGHPGGLDVMATRPAGAAYGADYPRQAEITEGMLQEAGFRTTVQQVDQVSEFNPKYRSNRGRFQGLIHRTSGGFGYDAIAKMRSEYYSKAGDAFFGFAAGGAELGDPYVDSQIEKATAEIDRDKRNAIAAELQRYLAKKQYDVKWPGGASSFKLAWPVLRNFNVFRSSSGGGRPDPYYWWIDDQQAPLKRA